MDTLLADFSLHTSFNDGTSVGLWADDAGDRLEALVAAKGGSSLRVEAQPTVGATVKAALSALGIEVSSRTNYTQAVLKLRRALDARSIEFLIIENAENFTTHGTTVRMLQADLNRCTILFGSNVNPSDVPALVADRRFNVRTCWLH